MRTFAAAILCAAFTLPALLAACLLWAVGLWAGFLTGVCLLAVAGCVGTAGMIRRESIARQQRRERLPVVRPWRIEVERVRQRESYRWD